MEHLRRPRRELEEPSSRNGVMHPAITKPLAMQIIEDGNINPQAECALLSKLPPEIHQRIFELAITQLDNGTFARICDHNRYVSKPFKVELGLHLSCRRIYVSVFKLPFLNIPLPADLWWHGFDFQPRLKQLSMWQFALITSLEVSYQQFYLDQGINEFVEGLVKNLRVTDRHEGKLLDAANSRLRSRNPNNLSLTEYHPFPAQQIKHLTIAIGPHDWRFSNNCIIHRRKDVPKLALDPDLGDGNLDNNNTATHAQMMENARLRRAGQEPAHRTSDETWRNISAQFPDLRTFSLKLETTHYQIKELDDVAECAKTWVFPLDERFELRCQGEVDKEWVELDERMSGHFGCWGGNEGMTKRKLVVLEVRVVRWKRVTKGGVGRG